MGVLGGYSVLSPTLKRSNYSTSRCWRVFTLYIRYFYSIFFCFFLFLFDNLPRRKTLWYSVCLIISVQFPLYLSLRNSIAWDFINICPYAFSWVQPNAKKNT